MNTLLSDTNIVSILFRPAHPLRERCEKLVSGYELAISFMTLAELHLWPRQHDWGSKRIGLLGRYLRAYLTLFPDETTCELWAEVRASCWAAGRPISPDDAWIAATAMQWDLPLVTENYKDFEAVPGLNLVRLR
jgi:tRNA(fMet)-specific endonuclease VapC